MIYFRPWVRRFVVLFEGRAGSGYTMEALNTHPAVKMYGEMLDPIMDQGAQAQLDRTRMLLTPERFGKYAAIGFKTKLRVILDADGFAHILRDTQAHVVHLYRRNRIKSVVSTFRLAHLKKATGHTRLYQEGDRPQPLVIDPVDFDRVLKQREEREDRLEQYVKQLQLPILTLCYEDMLLDEASYFAKLFAYLGVSDQTVKGRALKNTSDDLRTSVANFDELCAHYRGTLYEPMFSEVLVN